MDTEATDALDRADMQRLVAGHGAALNKLMDRHAARVFQFLDRMLGNQDDASDLAQETFLRVYRHCGRYLPEQRFSTWLYTIAGNLARNQHRWRSRHPNLSLNAATGGADQSLGDILPAAAPTPDQSTDAAERAEAVRAAVRDLPQEMREALILCEWEEMSVAEAAAVLEATPKAVESRLYRARQLLRAKLKNWL